MLAKGPWKAKRKFWEIFPDNFVCVAARWCRKNTVVPFLQLLAPKSPIKMTTTTLKKGAKEQKS